MKSTAITLMAVSIALSGLVLIGVISMVIALFG